MTIRTWMAEAAVVAGVLALTCLALHRGPVEWLGSTAVFASFLHAQVADRMRERQAASARPSVPCHARSTHYFVIKECLWCGYFSAIGAWSALVGVALFLAYPLWRAWWRRAHPMAVE
jgi:hypothetical protein